ncbi:NEW3 domain-containing protein [Brevibacillus humidisoli]|uniref:NEW3 domain-containing protein n=1 Tax=Brevibacillus humidisoli TaxID=2895522 RepID=UPI001E2FCC46|nr:NEW3 domain-containing protein [Brevibacillus humidisoli]UFJ39380.1 NEW3 domain-containing protein [Brevibacillus humidisoli]
MRKGKSFTRLLSLVTSVALLFSLLLPALSQTAYAERGVVDLWKAIKPLTTIASAMNTGAHPDDEHSAMLAYLALGRGVDTSSIIANRGEGGQNEIGSELFNALGVIRTRELQEASAANNVTLGILSEEINDPIFDFGFSKSPDETLSLWGEKVVYERLIRKIRELRPDVLIPAFLNDPSQHGHHRAISILTVRAFQDAANPDVFPEHLERGLHPWQVKKLYMPATEKDYTVSVPVGDYDEVYGASYLQLGEESRFMHKSQGMGRHYDEGPHYNYYKLANTSEGAVDQADKQKEADFFDGIAYTFADLAQEVASKTGGQQAAQGLRTLHKDAQEVMEAYPQFAEVAREVHEMKRDLEKTVAQVEASQLDEATRIDLLHRLRVKAEQLDKASAEAVSLVAKLRPETGELVAGQTTKMTVTAYNGGSVKLNQAELRLNAPAGWQVKPLGETHFAELGYNQTVSADFAVTVPNDAPLFHPYKASAVTADVSWEAFGSESMVRAAPTQTIAVLPAFSVSLDPQATVLNTRHPQEPIPVNVTVRNYMPGAATSTITLQVPDGWTVEPASRTLSFASKGETKSTDFTVKPAASVPKGKYMITAKAANGSVESSRDVQVIQYPHIGRTYLIQPTELTIQAFDLVVPEGLKVGYVSSGFDDIDQYLRQLGVDVVELDAKEIESGDLSQYDTIVLGIRAYGFRPELIPSNGRLLQYAKDGGNLVVQYHKPFDNWSPDLAPYPITVGSPSIEWRVTDETSHVTMLAPDHPIFNTPNKITEEDWQGWIQDRSLYNASEWGDEYVELISTGDPGEEEFTGIFLTAPYGKGTYTYSTLVWYREIPALVPGAIRMFVNMISLKQ